MAGYYRTPLVRMENNLKPSALARVVRGVFFSFRLFVFVSVEECPVDTKHANVR